MREIKFRAYLWSDKHTNDQWIDYYMGIMDFWENFTNWKAHKEIMQYTGLKDKNGNEIYEGDIVQYAGEYFNETADVAWYGTGSWGLHDREKYLDELIFSQAIRYDSSSGKPIYTEVEVIGNIYENPELIKGER